MQSAVGVRDPLVAVGFGGRGQGKKPLVEVGPGGNGSQKAEAPNDSRYLEQGSQSQGARGNQFQGQGFLRARGLVAVRGRAGVP